MCCFCSEMETCFWFLYQQKLFGSFWIKRVDTSGWWQNCGHAKRHGWPTKGFAPQDFCVGMKRLRPISHTKNCFSSTSYLFSLLTSGWKPAMPQWRAPLLSLLSFFTFLRENIHELIHCTCLDDPIVLWNQCFTHVWHALFESNEVLQNSMLGNKQRDWSVGTDRRDEHAISLQSRLQALQLQLLLK